MASRANPEAQERKLRSIYEALDNSANKKAVQLADRILKKQKDFVSIKGLKGLALLRMGRRDDAAAVIKEVRAVAQSEEATVQALTLYYRESAQPEELCRFYEDLVEKNAPSEELLAQLFMSYVRVGNHKLQQKTALALHKGYPTKNPYYFWAVMSVFLQAHESADSIANTVYLPLAERMADKMVKEEKIEAEAEVRLYLMILLRLQRYERALDIVHSNLGNLFHSHEELITFEVQILQHTCRWKDLMSLYRTELNKNPENWSSWSGYMNALEKFLATEESAECEAEFTLPGFHQFITDVEEALQDVNRPAPKSRNLHLARLELIKRVMASQLLTAKCDSLVLPSLQEAILGYIEVFGGKPTCFNDVRQYLDILPADAQKSVLDTATATAHQASAACKEEDSTSVKVSAVCRQCLSVQLARYTGQHHTLSAEERRQLTQTLMQQHAEGLPLGKDLLSTDVQYVDNLPLLAAHILLDSVNHLDGSNEVDLLRALVLLEHSLQASPSSSQLQLMALKLYCMAGAYDPCAIIFNQLQIKHFLLETIGYLWSGPVFGLGYFRSAAAVTQMMLGMNTETAEFLISAYRSGSFHKIIEIMNFKQDLQKSLQLATASALYQRVELLTKSHTIEEVVVRYQKTSPMVFPRVVAAQWRDLRDVRAMTSWAPAAEQMSDEQKKSSFELESVWVELRACLNRSVCCMCSAAATFTPATATASQTPAPAPATNGSTSAGAATTADNDDVDITYVPALGTPELAAKARTMDSGGLREAAELVGRIEKLCSQAAQHPGLRERYPIQGPHGTGLPAFLDGHHGNIHTAALIVAITTHNLLRPQQPGGSKNGSVADPVEAVRKSLEGMSADLEASSHVSEADQLDAVRKSLDGIASALEDGFARARAGLCVVDGDSRRFVGCGLEALVNVVDSLSSVVLLLSCANYFVTCSRGTSKKARKKKPTGVLGELLDLLSGAHIRLGDILSDVRAYADTTHKELVNKQLLSVPAAVLEQMPSEYSVAVEKVHKGITDSHQQALDAIRDVLDSKLRSFSAVRL
eukprot:scpid57500/ scgid22695/ N-alpha-acetyltransferase 25, NatB auxiliary subunit; Mitochondrial distribution and morphology protein 20; N-terminal acetyltransferase B complex subunit MDM20; N-terminal acetyltransferase B complex subunit NAA25; p120